MFQTTLSICLEGQDPAIDSNPPFNQKLAQTFSCGTPGAQWTRATYDGTVTQLAMPMPTAGVFSAKPAMNILFYNQPLNGVSVSLYFPAFVQGFMPEATVAWSTVLGPGQALLLPYASVGLPVYVEAPTGVSNVINLTVPSQAAPAYIDAYVF